MLKGKTKRVLALVLTACMVFALLPAAGLGANASGVSFTEIDPKSVTADTRLPDSTTPDTAEDEPAAEEEVRVIILFAQKSLARRGFSTKSLVDNPAAVAYSDSLKAAQARAVRKIEIEALHGQPLDIHYHYTIAVNGVAATVPYGQIPAILAVDGVEDVYLEEQYDLDVIAQPDTSTSGEMIGSYSAWADGYTGAGSRVAIIDTGLDLTHPSFSEGGYRYGLAISAASFGKEIADYNLLDKTEIAEILPHLSIAGDDNPPTAEQLYRNAKVPFAYNYVDNTLNVSHDQDEQGDHGTHVAGIAAANKYVPCYDGDGDLYYDRQELGVNGVAPDAQLVIMKVFGVGGGAYASDYMAAIEDAIWLKCDSVNLSLGSTSAGRSYAGTSDQSILDSFLETDTVVTMSGGNNGAWGDNVLNGMGMTETTDIRMHTGGSPGSYTNSFTVASVNNTGMSGIVAKFNGVSVIPNDTAESYGAKRFETLDTSADQSGTDYPYVFLGDPVKGEGIYGLPEDFAGVDLTGKIVVISRGNGSFFEKANRAAEAGAAAVVIHDNVDSGETINMNLTGYLYQIPVVMITLPDSDQVLAASKQDETTGLWGGTVKISAKTETVHGVSSGYKPSSFSSWGTTENLDLKPEIMTPGGNIYSTLNHGAYGNMSGTSMAAPSAAGSAAVIAQYIKENKLTGKTGLSVRELSLALMMSTSKPLTDPDTGIEYSPRQQGSGLMQVYEAATSPAYLLVGEKEGNTGKVKMLFGDDPARTGVYTGSFSINNLTDQPLVYDLASSTMTMEVVVEDGVKYMSTQSHALEAQATFQTEGKTIYVYDPNGDGAVDEKDALLLLKIANGTAPALDAEQTALYDFDADGTISTADAQLYLAALEGDTSVFDVSTMSYEVPANGSLEIAVTLSLTAADKTWLNENYPNGAYIEGFLYAEASSGKQMSLPMLGFYGNWTDPSMYDKSVYVEDRFDETKAGYVSTQPNILGVRFAGSSTEYILGANLWATEDFYQADRPAFNTVAGNSLYHALPTMIRNASNLTASISNAETGELYKTVDYGSATGAYYASSTATWEATNTSITLSWKGLMADNKTSVPEGTKVDLTVTAVPEYYWDRENKKVTGELGKGATWVSSFYVDNTAPEILNIVLNADAITGERSFSVTVKDNRYTAAVLLMTADGKQVVARKAVNQSELGAAMTVDFSLEGIYSNDLVVAAVDYASNMSSYLTNFGGNVETPEARANLRAAVPGENNTTYLVEFDTEAENDTVILNEDAPLAAPLLSVARGPENRLYLASNETAADNTLVSALYSVDETDYSLKKIGTTSESYAYTCMAWMPHLKDGTMFAGYGYYLLAVDTNTGAAKSLGSFSSVIGSGNAIVGMTYVGSYETEDYGTVDTVAMMGSDGSIWMIDMVYSQNRYLVYAATQLGFVPELNPAMMAGSSLYYADNRLYISALTTSASKICYVDLTAEIFWPITLGGFRAAPIAIYSATPRTDADSSQLAPWAERQTKLLPLEPAEAGELTGIAIPALPALQ